MIEEGVERDGAGEGGCGAGRGYVKDGVGKWWVGFVHRFKLYNNIWIFGTARIITTLGNESLSASDSYETMQVSFRIVELGTFRSYFHFR